MGDNMKLRIPTVLAAALLAASCNTIDGGPLIRDGMPTGTIEIENQTSYTFNAVNLSECDAMSHGFNRLSSGQSIPPGGVMSWTVTAGCWDIGAGAIGVGDSFNKMQVAPGGISRFTVNG